MMSVDSKKIMDAVLGMGLRGDPETGLLRAFGLILAINSVDYLVDRELAYLGHYPDALEMVEKSLIDAAQWCANATFGGMMKSEAWAKLCEPMITTTRDRLEALHAIQNCLGWGRIAGFEFDEVKRHYKMVVEHSYYVDNYLRKYGRSDRPKCYMWNGVAAGNMDLILGKKVHDFEAKEVKCGCMGDDLCEFIVTQVTEMFSLL